MPSWLRVEWQQAGSAALRCPVEGQALKARSWPPPRPLSPPRDTSGRSGWVGSLPPRRNRAPDPDRSVQSAARETPPVTLGPSSPVPSERAGTALWTAVPGDGSSDIIDSTFLSRCFMPALCTCGGQSDQRKKLSRASRPKRPSVGHLSCLSVPRKW
ncbi:hypothetical protein P7K49_000194 [Saguinus oedipus]|uniref:Uncharacterized protein n=1 Tax=Saguinus oedipus TaxID=9490 RepID=A0ABQ9WDG2_SAGOE|nr:hypothetical protein P7K49_000194 [Saguinus oedipus]